MDNTEFFNTLKNLCTSIVNNYGYSEDLLDDDYLLDFLIDFETMFKYEEVELLMAYKAIFEYKLLLVQQAN